MGENPESESKAAPATRESAETQKVAAKPEIPASVSAASAGSKRLLFIAVAALMLAVAAASAGVATWRASRSAFEGEQRAAFEKLGQSLQQMERQIAASQAHDARAPASGDRHSPAESSGLLDTANLRYHEGKFQEAAASFRAAVEMGLAGAFTDETHYRYAESLLETGRFGDALVEFQTIQADFPGSAYFAPAALESARLLYSQKSYGQARRVLYGLLAAKDRLVPAAGASIEQACFFIGRCYEAEAESLDTARQPSPAPLQTVAHAGSAPGASLARADNPEHTEGN